MNESVLTVFLADDEKIIRDGMKKLFAWETNGFRVCGEAANGRDALPQILSLSPDIVITDLKMPFMDGIALAHAVAERAPITETVIVTGFDEFAYAKEAVRAGVFDFLLKPVSPAELKNTMLRLREKILHRNVSYPFAEETCLVRAIAENNAGRGMDALSSAFAYLAQNRVPPDMTLKICEKLLAAAESAYKAGMGSCACAPRPVLTSGMPLEDIKAAAEEYLMQIFGSDTSASTEMLVEKLKRYLEEHYQENVTLKTLEDAFFFNASYISRVFKSKTGENYSDFLLKIRIEHAKALLANSNRSIRQISEMVGFGNPKYFSRVFKDMTRLQPIAYRQAHHYNRNG